MDESAGPEQLKGLEMKALKAAMLVTCLWLYMDSN